MAEQLSLKINIGGKEQVVTSVKEIKKAIKEAEAEAFLLSEQFGATDDRVIAIRREVGALKDSLKDAAEQSNEFAEGQAFPIIGKSIQGLASGFTAVQGAMALVGIESENVEKTLLKVQSAMALSQSLQGIDDGIKAFTNLGARIKSSTFFLEINNAVTKAAAFIQRLFTGAVNTTSTAFNGLKAAIIGTGIGALIVAIGLVINEIMDWTEATDEQTKAQEKLNAEIDKENSILDQNAKDRSRRNNVILAQMKAQGKSEGEIRKYQLNESYKDYEIAFKNEEDARRRYNENINKVNAEGLKKLSDDLAAKEIVTKDAYANYQQLGYNQAAEEIKLQNDKNKELLEKQKQALAEREQAAKDKEAREQAAFEVQKQAYLDTLAERQKAILEVENEYEERRKTLLRNNITDFTSIEEAKRKKIADINKQYDEQEKKDQEEKYKEQKERLLALITELRQIDQAKIQNKIDAIDEENAKVEGDYQQDIERLKGKSKLIDELEKSELSNTELTEYERTQIRDKYAKERNNLSKEEVEIERASQQAKIDLNNAYLDLASQFGGFLQQIAGKNKGLAIAGVVVEQVAAISKIISNTGIANAKSVAASPITGGMPWVAVNTASAGISIASTIANAVKSINQIKATGGVEGGGASPQTSAPSSAAPLSPQGALPMETSLNQASINALGNQAIRTYVIESDLTTNQQRIAAIKQRARFS